MFDWSEEMPRVKPRRRQKTRPNSSAPVPAETGGFFRRRPTELRARRRAQDGAWELVYPRSALERMDDLEEVEQMLAAGEREIAVEELRWLLDGCRDFLPAHRLLGELALENEDYRLARGHFGYACEIGLSAAPAEAVLPYRVPANQGLLESLKGLALCLVKLDRPAWALEVLRELLRRDPSDPLAVQTWVAQLAAEPPPA